MGPPDLLGRTFKGPPPLWTPVAYAWVVPRSVAPALRCPPPPRDSYSGVRCAVNGYLRT